MEVHTLKLGFIPRADPRLLVWYHSLSIEDKTKFEGHFGFLGSLLEVKHDKDILESLITFWDPETAVFRFGEQELTPTLEEYAGLLKLPIRNDPVQPNFKIGKTQVSDFLGINRDILEKEFLRFPMDFLISRYMTPGGFNKRDFCCEQEEWQNKRLWVLALCLLAHLLFPREDRKVDMALIEIVIQIRNGRTFIPTILAETLRTLTFCKQRGKGFLTASVGLLQIWLVSHLVQGSCTSQGFMHRDIIKPLNKLSPPTQANGRWCEYLAQLEGQDIQWYLGWGSSRSIRVQTRELPFIPLLGISGVAPYAPGRVLRQFKRLQHIPQIGDMSFFHFSYSSPISRERYNKALNQWGLIILDEWIGDESKVGVDPEYIKWIEENKGQSSGSKRPRMEEPGVQEHIKRLRNTLKCEETARAQVERERDQFRTNLGNAQARINQLEYTVLSQKDWLVDLRDAERRIGRFEQGYKDQLANQQKAQVRIDQLEHTILAQEDQLQEIMEDNSRLTGILHTIKDLTMDFPLGDFSTFKIGYETAQVYMWSLLRLMF